MTDLSLPILEYSVQRRPRPLAVLSGPIAWVAAPVALGLALQVNYGQFHPFALRWLTVSLLACITVVFQLGRKNRAHAGASDGRLLVAVMGAGLAVQIFLLLTSSPIASHAFRYESELLPFRSFVALAAICTAAALMSSRFRHPALFAMLALHFLAGLWVLRVTPPPPVDVCMFQRDACAALLAGHNPYALTFPLPYNDPARVYAPGTFANGRLLFGYPYPPLSLLLVLPGYLFGDFRYALLAATTLAGALIALARPGRIATAAAALFLFTPRGFFVLEAGWTEPLVVLLLAVVVFALCRGMRAAPIVFGLLLVTKQYLVLAAPLALFLKRFWIERTEFRGTGGPPVSSIQEKTRAGRPCHATEAGKTPTPRKVWICAILLPLLISLPLILWSVPAFMHSAVLLQFRQPLRMDALSYAPWFLTQTGLHLPMWLPFIAAAGAIALVLRQPSRTPTALAAGVALVFFLFFALNKQAFCNYYFFVIGAMCCALATQPSKPARSLCD